MEELTDKIVLVVLDYLDHNSGVRTDSRTKELLIGTAEKLRQIAATIDAQLLPSQTSQIDDLTIMCTHDVIDGIIHVCHPNELTKQGIQEVMQELGSITGSGGSSSKNNVEIIDLEETKVTSVPVIGEAASSHSRQNHESVLSDEFHQKVKRAVSDALLKTTGAVSAHFSKTFEDITVEDLEVCAEQSGTSSKSSVLVEEAASDIAETILEDLKKVSSQNGSVTEPAPSRNTFRAAAYRLYKKVHFKVFGFLLRLQESDSEKEEKISTSAVTKEDQSSLYISPPPHIIPRIQVQVDSWMDEVYVKVVEKYNSEPLLPSCSCRRASSSAALTSTTPVAEAVHRHLESMNTAWATMNSSREMLSRLDDVSITPEGPRTSRPFFGFRRVKDFLFASNNNNDKVSVDPDPVTEKKTGLRFSKRLSRTFSAIRRALPNPFQCMTGPP